jgi:hypothetical protein
VAEAVIVAEEEAVEEAVVVKVEVNHLKNIIYNLY